MSEYQNKAVELLIARYGEDDAADIESCRDRFFQEAAEMFKILGGSSDCALFHLRTVYSSANASVTDAIGDVMGSIAAISRLNDADMMQAAYNRLDAGWREIEEEQIAKTQLRG